jgi:hypothetical protein
MENVRLNLYIPCSERDGWNDNTLLTVLDFAGSEYLKTQRLGKPLLEEQQVCLLVFALGNLDQLTSGGVPASPRVSLGPKTRGAVPVTKAGLHCC